MDIAGARGRVEGSGSAVSLAAAQGVQKDSRGVAVNDDDKDQGLCGGHSPSSRGSTPTASRVIVVDGDRAWVRRVEGLLTANGYEVATAANGADALRILRDQGAQIVVMGWKPSGLQGPELCRAIRADEGAGFVYLIVMAGRPYKRALVESFECGADDFMTRPFDGAELLLRMQAGGRIVRLEADLARQRREIFRQNAEMIVLNTKLERLATTDALTGMLNRRHAMSKVDELWRLASRYHVPFSCILFDIDHFKRFNDEHGHAVGDQVLRSLAATVSRAIRSIDVAARIGGEEFLLLCPNTDLAGAAVLAERVRKRVERTVVRHDQLALRVTISLGVAEHRLDMSHVDEFLKDADDALYSAKASGRNCVRVAPDAFVSRECGCPRA